MHLSVYIMEEPRKEREREGESLEKVVDPRGLCIVRDRITHNSCALHRTARSRYTRRVDDFVYYWPVYIWLTSSRKKLILFLAPLTAAPRNRSGGGLAALNR